jgi:LuxR family transcriptional regulator, quorum-sensing system regulator CciR
VDVSESTKDVEAAVAVLRIAPTLEILAHELARATVAMGFTYYSLMHHIHPNRWKRNAIALHNCPEEWAFVYADKRLYANDPILHACSQTNVGFIWDDLPDLIEMTERRQKVLSLGYDSGPCSRRTHGLVHLCHPARSGFS